MNGFLVKLGKARGILKQDGFLVGMKNILRKILQVLRMILKWPKGEIIFISGLTGAVAMYRTDYVAEELNEYGFKADVLYEDDPFLVSKVKKVKVIVLNRVSWNDNIQKLVKQAEVLGQSIIYDTDDLTFDVELFKQSEMYVNFNEAQKEQYEKTTGLEILESKQLKAITTTTSFLAEKLSRFKKPVFVVRNKLSKQELQWTREARKIYLRRASRDEDVRLGFFSGSVSHNRDFATIVPALEAILSRYKNVKLYLVGYLSTGDEFYKKFKDQIVQLPFVPRKKHYQNIAEVDINLAPLEMTDFCQSKSELKFFEAGIIGIPTVAVENQTFLETIAHGKDSLLSKDTNAWVDNLERLIDDKELRITLGEKARQKVLKKYLTDSGDNVEYYEFLKKSIKR
jgi:glycosyltransferase involved in cell wall biosynthesis